MKDIYILLLFLCGAGKRLLTLVVRKKKSAESFSKCSNIPNHVVSCRSNHRRESRGAVISSAVELNFISEIDAYLLLQLCGYHLRDIDIRAGCVPVMFGWSRCE